MIDLDVRVFPYQKQLLAHLMEQEAEHWKEISSEKSIANYADAIRLELLKSTYRMDRDAHPALYVEADEALEVLELSIPVTLYQAQATTGTNAYLSFLPGEAHIVFVGDLLKILSTAERKAVIGHELAHHLLYSMDEGAYFKVARLLNNVAAHPRASDSFSHTQRFFELYAELFCDRGSFKVTGDHLVAISGLVKATTGLADVHAESYVRQAEEIFSKAEILTEGLSHPETFIRARSLRLWAELGDASNDEIERMIQGPIRMDQLDLLRQKELTALTRRLISSLLSPRWMRTDAMLAHARLFFEDFGVDTVGTPEEDLDASLKAKDPKLQDYLCYILLDFVVSDRDLEEAPLALALRTADRLEIADRFEEIARKELKLSKKVLTEVRTNMERLLQDAERGKGSAG